MPGLTKRVAAALAVLTLFLVTGCENTGTHYHPEENPVQLSAWGVLQRDGDDLLLAADSLPYSLNSALFSDYTHKLRSVYLPPGGQARADAQGQLAFNAYHG